MYLYRSSRSTWGITHLRGTRLRTDCLRDYFMNQGFYHNGGQLICQSLHSHEMFQIYNQSFPHLDCFRQVTYLPIRVILTYPAVPQNISIFHIESDRRILMFATDCLFSQKLIWNLIIIHQMTAGNERVNRFSRQFFFSLCAPLKTNYLTFTFFQKWLRHQCNPCK